MHADRLHDLDDFTTSRRVLPISGLAMVSGIFAAYVAAALLKLIGLFTNLFFFQRSTPPCVTRRSARRETVGRVLKDPAYAIGAPNADSSASLTS